MLFVTLQIIFWIFIIIAICLCILFIYDRFIQNKNVVIGQFPVLGRMRYVFHELRPFFRQYFGDDNAFTPRIVIDWILHVSHGTSGYFAFDKFDTSGEMHDGKHQMIHSATPLNVDEMKAKYPILWEERRKFPLAMKSYFYRSAMSLGAIGFEATSAMAAACVDAGAPFNTGEWGFAVHHIPRVAFSPKRKFFKSLAIPKAFKTLYKVIPGPRLKNRFIDRLWAIYLEKWMRDLYLFDHNYFVFYTIDWSADIKHFPKPWTLTEEFGQVILQIGSWLYGLRKARKDDVVELDWDRFGKIMSFCSAVEIKLAQGAKQTGGILTAVKNTPVVANIRGVHPWVDLISPNRFPFYNPGWEKEFLEFCQELSKKSWGKPVWAKLVISDKDNVEGLAKAMAKDESLMLDWINVDGGDGWSGAAPIALWVLFWKKVYDALPIVQEVLTRHKIRDKMKVLSAAKLYAPHMSARAMALWADAIGNARSIMISGGCIRAGLCSGEHGTCPVGLATMEKKNRRAYAQAWDAKVQQISNYITAHNKGVLQVASICGVESPTLLTIKHIATMQIKK